MATKLYKDGKSSFFEASDVPRKLKEGWSVTAKPLPVKKKPVSKKD